MRRRVVGAIVLAAVAADALRAAGKDVALHVYPGEPHEFIDVWPAVMERTVAFFDSHLSLAADSSR